MKFDEWEKVKMFRCLVDPMIGPKPKQAFMMPDMPGFEAWLHTPSGTIYVTTPQKRRHVVGVGNWSSIELWAEDAAPKTIQEAAQIPRHRRKPVEIAT